MDQTAAAIALTLEHLLTPAQLVVVAMGGYDPVSGEWVSGSSVMTNVFLSLQPDKGVERDVQREGVRQYESQKAYIHKNYWSVESSAVINGRVFIHINSEQYTVEEVRAFTSHVEIMLVRELA